MCFFNNEPNNSFLLTWEKPLTTVHSQIDAGEQGERQVTPLSPQHTWSLQISEICLLPAHKRSVFYIYKREQRDEEKNAYYDEGLVK